MDKEELLKIAKEKYPIGTVFKSASTHDIFTVANHNNYASTNICFGTLEQNQDGNYYGCVYSSKGNWAKIISTPVKYYELW
jgi:hypothetical protein